MLSSRGYPTGVIIAHAEGERIKSQRYAGAKCTMRLLAHDAQHWVIEVERHSDGDRTRSNPIPKGGRSPGVYRDAESVPDLLG